MDEVLSRSPTGGRNPPSMSPRLARTATLAALVLAVTAASAQAQTPSAYVYATSFDRVVRQYSADAAGSLAPLVPPSAPADDASTAVAATPDGHSLYVVNADGGLTAVSETAAGDGAMQIALTPDGDHAFVANVRAGTVSEYTVGADGSLSSNGEVSTPSPAAIAVTPDGANAYVVNRATTGTVSQFAIGSDGTLTAKSPATVATGTTPVALTATDDSVYVSNFGANAISQYDVGAEGELTPKSTPTVATGRNPWGLVVAPDGKSLYAAAFSDRVIDEYDIGAGGALTAKATPSVPTALRPVAVTAVPYRDPIAPTVDLRTPADGAQYDLGERVTADYSCADEGGSGLQSCEGDVESGAAIDTSTAGPHEFTVTARDGAGNTTTVNHGYTAADPGYDFGGFLGSILDGVRVRAGDPIPIVFSLGGDHGLDVLAPGSPSSGQVGCDAGGEPSETEPARSRWDQGLRFNAQTGHYVFWWQTEKSWAGTCRAFELGLNDGSVHRLVVRFRSKCRQARSARR